MGALDGVRVVDISTMLAGPATGMLLGDLGADVIKVEPPMGDSLRYMNWRYDPESAPFFLAVNRNKRGIVLDLREPSGQKILQRLLADADVLIHNLRPDVAEQMGLAGDALRETHARLITCEISAWGATGAWARRPGIDSLVQAMGGLMSTTGERDGRFLRAGVPLIDMTTSLAASAAIMAALISRSRTGNGETVDVSLLSEGIFLQGPMFSYAFDTGENPPRMGNRSHMAVILEGNTSTGGLLVGLPTQKFWVKLCECIERTDLLDDPDFQTHESRLNNQDRLAEEVEARFADHPRELWLDRLVEAGVPCAPINDYHQVMQEEQVNAIEAFLQIDLTDSTSAVVANAPWRFGGVGSVVRLTPPSLGRDTEAVLRECGYTDNEICSLFDTGVTQQRVL